MSEDREEAMEANREAYDRVVEQYSTRELHPPERRLLTLFSHRWHRTDMLDLGVGAGRTAYTFAPLAKNYVGIDYSPRMIARAKEVVGETRRARFLVADAAELDILEPHRFDLVLFSFNGIDYVSHAKRIRILGRIGAKLREGDSYFLFSSHNLDAFPLRHALPRFSAKEPVRWAYRLMREMERNARCRKINGSVDLDAARKRGWAIVNDGLHDFSITTYYVKPRTSVRQVRDAGMDVVAMFDTRGRAVSWGEPLEDPWLYYLCRPKRTDSTHCAPGKNAALHRLRQAAAPKRRATKDSSRREGR